MHAALRNTAATSPCDGNLGTSAGRFLHICSAKSKEDDSSSTEMTSRLARLAVTYTCKRGREMAIC